MVYDTTNRYLSAWRQSDMCLSLWRRRLVSRRSASPQPSSGNTRCLGIPVLVLSLGTAAQISVLQKEKACSERAWFPRYPWICASHPWSHCHLGSTTLEMHHLLLTMWKGRVRRYSNHFDSQLRIKCLKWESCMDVSKPAGNRHQHELSLCI